MRSRIVGQHQHRRLAGFREVARYAVHEVGPHAVEAVQIRLNRGHRHIGLALAKLLGPDVLSGIVHVIRLLRSVPYRLAQDGGDHARRRAFHQLHPERAADAIAEEEKLADAKMVHHAELVVGESVPGIVDRNRAGRVTVGGVALVHSDHAEVVLELLYDVDHGGWPYADARV